MMRKAAQRPSSSLNLCATNASRCPSPADVRPADLDNRSRIFQRGGRTYQVCAPLDARTVVCRDLHDGTLVEFSTDEVGLPPTVIPPSATGPLRDAPDSVRKETARRRRYLREIAQDGITAFRRGAQLRRAIQTVAQRIGDRRPPSDSAVARWWQALLREGLAGLMSHTDRRGGKGKSRLPIGNVEKLASAVALCLRRPRPSVTEILGATNRQVELENAWAIDAPARPISRSTLYRAIRMVPAIERLSTRFGTAEAHRMLMLSKANPDAGPTRPLQQVQSDHGVLDVVVVDEITGESAGRPYLSVMLCVATRMVVAWEISLATPNEATVLALLRQAMTGLTEESRHAGRTDDASQGAIQRRLAHGQIEALLFDRAKEFDAAAVQAACTDLDVITLFCPAYRPDSKGHVERFIGTVNRSFISSLPGTTYGTPKERRGYDAVDQATLTMPQLRTVLQKWIDTVYALSPHHGLNGAAPLHVWQHLAASHRVDSLHSDEAVARTCRPRVQRHIGKSGIKLFGNQRYGSMELEAMRFHHGLHCEVTVRYEPTDIGQIWVTDPVTRLELMVPNVDPGYARGLTLREHDLVRRRKRAGARRTVDEVQLAANREAVRAEIEKAQLDKTMRRRKAAAIAKDAHRGKGQPPLDAGARPPLGEVQARERRALPGYVLRRTAARA